VTKTMSSLHGVAVRAPEPVWGRSVQEKIETWSSNPQLLEVMDGNWTTLCLWLTLKLSKEIIDFLKLLAGEIFKSMVRSESLIQS